MRRAAFAKPFLEALGASEVRFSDVNDAFVQGTVIYHPNVPEEKQDFRWRVREEEVPSDDAIRLVELLRDEKLLDIDKLRISRKQLRERFASVSRKDVSESELSDILDSIETVEIAMLDDGEEAGDCFFIHE